MKRRTVSREVCFRGIGIHGGQEATLCIRPGERGIVFLSGPVCIPAVPENVVDTALSTSIGSGGVVISTIEHLMSCLWGLSITDCEIEVSGREIPVADGSASPFYALIRDAGIKELPGETFPVRVREGIRAEEGGSWIEAVPGPFSITYEIDFPSRAIGRQCHCFDGRNYETEVAPARTFGMLRDVERMRSAGLALGGSLENAVVADDDKVLNPEGLRFGNECIRHKILDLLGDLWTIGAPLEAQVRAYKASHRLHIALAKKIREAYLLKE